MRGGHFSSGGAGCYLGMPSTDISIWCDIGGTVRAAKKDSTVIGKYAGYSGTKHLIVAFADYINRVPWGCNSTKTNAINLADGKVNTDTILGTYCGSTFYAAVQPCRNMGPDWFLPSIDQLVVIRANKQTIGGFVNDYYWSSTEYGTSSAYVTGVYAGTTAGEKNVSYPIRCARYF